MATIKTKDVKLPIAVGIGPPIQVFHNGFKYRRRVVLRSRQVSDITSNIVVLIATTQTWLKSLANGGELESAGNDMRIELEDGTLLDFDLETINLSTGYMRMWVRLPIWDLSQSYRFFFYYGKSGAASGENRVGAWSGTLATWDPITGEDLKNAGQTLTAAGTGTITQFNANLTADYPGAAYLQALNAPFLSGKSELTITMWVKADAVGTNRGVLAHGPRNGVENNHTISLRHATTGARGGATNVWIWQLNLSTGVVLYESPASMQTTNAVMLHMTWKSGELPEFYINGNRQTPSWVGKIVTGTASQNVALTGVISTLSGNFYLGAGVIAGSAGVWDGLIGDVRILNQRLSADNVKAEYDNHIDALNFFGFSDEELAGYTPLSVVARPIADLINAGATKDFDVAAAAFVPPGYPAPTLTSVSSPVGGSVSIVDGKARFVSSASGVGTAGFDFVVSAVKTSTARARLNVLSPISSGDWDGPHSGLGWYSGGWYWYAELDSLRTNPANGKKRKMDATTTFFWRGGWRNRGQSTVTNETASYSHSTNWILANDTPAINIAIAPFCCDPNFGGGSPTATLANWPSSPSGITVDHWIAPNRPVGYQATGLSNDTKVNLIMEVWQRAANGWFDHIWEPELNTFKSGYIVAKGLTNKRLIWRPFWESNGGQNIWGATGAIYCSSVLAMRTQAHATIIKAALKHYNDILKSIFPGCLVHWCPLPDNLNNGHTGFGSNTGLTGMDVVNPLDWDIIGPDYYDILSLLGVTSGTYTDRWNVQSVRGTQTVPVGILKWMDYVRNVAKPINPNIKFGVGEWGLQPSGGSLQGGGDDPVFIQKMYEMFAANADIMAYECYFNDKSGKTLLGPPGSGTLFPNASAAYQQKYGTLP